MKFRALDLFCGAGGATKGLQRAGFYVTGVDIQAQPRYCGDVFIQADAMEFPLEGYDFIWASPPCQAYTYIGNNHRAKGKTYPDLIAPMRERLEVSGAAWIIENVPGSPLRASALLCGSAFGLRVRRHRFFESSFGFFSTGCYHALQGPPIDVSGTGGRRVNRRPDDHGGNTNKPRNLTEARAAIGIDWMNRYEISQAIPPAYAEFIGKQAMQFLNSRKESYVSTLD